MCFILKSFLTFRCRSGPLQHLPKFENQPRRSQSALTVVVWRIIEEIHLSDESQLSRSLKWKRVSYKSQPPNAFGILNELGYDLLCLHLRQALRGTYVTFYLRISGFWCKQLFTVRLAEMHAKSDHVHEFLKAHWDDLVSRLATGIKLCLICLRKLKCFWLKLGHTGRCFSKFGQKEEPISK